MFGRAFRVLAEGWLSTSKQRQARFKAPAHVFQKGRAGCHVKLQHFRGQLQLHPRIAFGGEALQRATVFGQSQVNAMQILQMRRNTLAAFTG
jgi:hypothetical protein